MIKNAAVLGYAIDKSLEKQDSAILWGFFSLYFWILTAQGQLQRFGHENIINLRHAELTT